MARPKNKSILPGFTYDQDHPLARAKREGAPASQALNDYALQGSTRSFDKLLAMYGEMDLKWKKYLEDVGGWLATGHQPPAEPPSINRDEVYRWSFRFAWAERVERHDEMRKRLDQLEFDAQRVALKKRRVEILDLTLSRLQSALVSLNPNDASWGEVTAGITKITEALRIEMGDGGVGGGGMPRARIQMVVVNMPSPAGQIAAGGDVLEAQEVRDALEESVSESMENKTP